MVRSKTADALDASAVFQFHALLPSLAAANVTLIVTLCRSSHELFAMTFLL